MDRGLCGVVWMCGAWDARGWGRVCCFLCDAVLFSSTEFERRGVPPGGSCVAWAKRGQSVDVGVGKSWAKRVCVSVFVRGVCGVCVDKAFGGWAFYVFCRRLLLAIAFRRAWRLFGILQNLPPPMPPFLPSPETSPLVHHGLVHASA